MAGNVLLNRLNTEAPFYGASDIILSATQKQQAGRIVVVRVAQIAPVVEAEPVIIRLEIERISQRISRRLPLNLPFPAYFHRKRINCVFCILFSPVRTLEKDKECCKIYSATLISQKPRCISLYY